MVRETTRERDKRMRETRSTGRDRDNKRESQKETEATMSKHA